MRIRPMKRFSCLLLMLFLGLNGFAQSYSFTSYNVEEGLPYIQVYSLYQDHKGYLWSGGYGGLSYFEGQKFHAFTTDDGLSNHWVNGITEDDKGGLWVATIDGLNLFHDNKFKVFKTNNGLPDNFINSVFHDPLDNIWVATKAGAVKIHNGIITELKSLHGINVFVIYSDAENNLWVGTDKGLYLLNNKGDLQTVFNLSNGMPSVNITSIKQDLNQKILVGTKSGLVVFDPYKKLEKVYSVTTGLFDPEINTLLVDRKNNYWIGTNSGLVKFDGKYFSYLSLGEEANSNKIAALSMDYEQNIWIGTFNGLFKFRGDMLVNYGATDGLKGAFIYQIIQDAAGILWMGTESNGVYSYDGINFHHYGEQEGLKGKRATAIVQKDDKLLFGTEAGLTIFKNNTFKNYGPENGLNISGINVLYKDAAGQIWAGGKNALALISFDASGKPLPTFYNLPSKGADYDIWGFAEDKSGNLWIGTYLAGLYCFNGREIIKVETWGEKIKSGSFLEMKMAGERYLYCATLEGVMIMDLEKKTHSYIDHHEGLNSDLTYALTLTADKKYLWVGTNQGINRVSLKSIAENNRPEIISFGKNDGLKGVECNSGGLFEDKSGVLWIGTVNGLSKFNPSAYTPNTSKPKLNLTGIKLFYKDTVLKNNVELPYNINSISFEYIGVCLTNPAKVKYMCKLEGFDKNWSPETNENFKTYSNLGPGKYTFSVKSCNNEGVWNENEINFSFTILVPWYRSWWFLTFAFLGITTIVLIIFRIRLNQEKKIQAKELKAHIEISKNELKALRAQINPHFIFNSLNSIQHFIIENDNAEATRYLNKFARLFRMILNNSEKASVSIREEIDMLTIYLELESMRFNNKFDYEFVIDPKIDPDYEEMPTMLLQPYIENAILHGLTPKKDKGKLTVKITTTGKFLICTIEDNGIGRKRAGEIRTSQKASDKHKSLGMKITQDRLSLLNAINGSELSMNITDLTDEKGLAAGTRVDIYIPII